MILNIKYYDCLSIPPTTYLGKNDDDEELPWREKNMLSLTTECLMGLHFVKNQWGAGNPSSSDLRMDDFSHTECKRERTHLWTRQMDPEITS